MTFRLFIYLLASFASTLSWAEDCANINLEQPGQSMANVPALNQGNTLYCQGYALAQAIDAYRFSHGDTDVNFHTSPLYLETIAGIRLNPNSTDLAEIQDLNAAAAQRGICDVTAIPSEFNAELTRELEILNLDFNTARANPSLANRCQIYQDLTALARVTPDLLKISRWLAQEDLNANIAHGLLHACQGPHKKTYTLKLHDYVYDPGEVFADKQENVIRTVVARGTPLLVAIDACVFYRKTRAGFSVSGMDCKSVNNLNHMALLTGEREDPRTKKCQYRIRNSWGADCGKANGLQCENGSAWIDKDQFLKFQDTRYTFYLAP